MSPEAVLYSAGLCGLLTLAAFGYGAFYVGSKMLAVKLIYGAHGCYFIVAALAILIFLSTPLGIGWKILIVASAVVYAAVPPVTWRFLVKLHAPEEQHS
ncbi:MAG: hypothetical protein KGL98_06700 [Gammaproteobacteria bacterium]|nr:hypothetical protein [Gammaproteobacteria bacterium]MBU6508747.1 hypothetical protein [Gammaproteobacteria bacterium]MDE1983053.1 hypothetical protein [Gammaproteobacteria bacterium]MDE2107638.1 hypothetical protein [Gammaproteobacteria bacterium]MDE2460921.1 hypothetical protein [Gammaproteobacteria bacterium]